MNRQFSIPIFAAIILFGLIAPAFAPTGDQLCEQCGMTVDAMNQARFNIVDVDGTRHYACCPICTLKLVKTYGQLNITSFCDYNGPVSPITIKITHYGSVVTLSPPSALLIIGGSCAKNRIVYDAAAADLLLAPPNNGTSQWLSPITNDTVLPNATRIGIVQAALKYGGGWPDLNGDNTVDIFDAIDLAGDYNSYIGSPNWNPNADINGDSVVDKFDAITLSDHFGQHYP